MKIIQRLKRDYVLHRFGLMVLASLFSVTACGDSSEKESVSQPPKTHEVISLKTVGEENHVRSYRIPIEDLQKPIKGECAIADCIVVSPNIEGYEFIYGIGNEKK